MVQGPESVIEPGLFDGIIDDTWSLGFKPRDSRPIYEKAKTRFYLPARLARGDGYFNVDSSRMFIGPFDALDNGRIREVNVLAPVRDGKSLIGDVWLQDLILDYPGPLRWVFGDDKQAEDHENERIKPSMMANPTLARFVPRGRIEEIAGMPIAIDGPALGNLQARGYKYMILDEPWMWPEGRLTEAKERQKDFRILGNNKLLCLSQGGSEKCEDWKRQFHSGLIHEWYIQCQGCGKYMLPVWSGFREDGSRWGMRWDEHREPNGLWNVAKAVTTARFECLHCGHAHVDTPLLKQRWNLTGKYIAETADKNDKKVSFHWTGVATYLFAELVDLFLNAANQRKHGSLKALVIFFQKQMAEFATEQSISQSGKRFATQKIEINSDWPEEDGRVMSADRQAGGVYYVMIRQWSGRARKSRRLWRGVVQGEEGLIVKQKEFNVPPLWVFIDSGHWAKGPGGVYAMCIRNGWVATKGVGTVRGNAHCEGFWHTVDVGNGKTVRVQRTYSEPGEGDPETGVADRAIRILFSTDLIADILDGLISSGAWEEPPNDGSPEEKDYLEQMAAEFKDEDKKRVCPSKRNHYYDAAKNNTSVAVINGWLPDPLDNRPQLTRPK